MATLVSSSSSLKLIMLPNPTAETYKPVLPKNRYSIKDILFQRNFMPVSAFNDVLKVLYLKCSELRLKTNPPMIFQRYFNYKLNTN